MNRLEATVVTGSGGEVDYRGVRLVVDAARERPDDTRVLVLVRPESLEVERVADGDAPTRAFPVGIRVVVRFPPDSPRILALPPS